MALVLLGALTQNGAQLHLAQIGVQRVAPPQLLGHELQEGGRQGQLGLAGRAQRRLVSLLGFGGQSGLFQRHQLLGVLRIHAPLLHHALSGLFAVLNQLRALQRSAQRGRNSQLLLQLQQAPTGSLE